MKMQVASDLHHEMAQPFSRLAMPLAVGCETDVLVLAGDIHEGTKAIELYGSCKVPVVYVPGNTEPNRLSFENYLEEARACARSSSVHFLREDELVLGEVRFLCTMLWTDYSFYPLLLDDALGSADTERETDAPVERGVRRFFRPEDAREHQRRTLRWLAARLDEPFTGTTVVVTHHAPSGLSIPQRNQARSLDASDASNVELLTLKSDLWVHGHIHESSDYQIGTSRVICNPRGRPRPNSKYPTIPYENAKFNPLFVVDV
jgi:Icc-related predicted phosphoesterase